MLVAEGESLGEEVVGVPVLNWDDLPFANVSHPPRPISTFRRYVLDFELTEACRGASWSVGEERKSPGRESRRPRLTCYVTVAHCDYKPSDDWCVFVFVSTTSIRRRKNVKRNARQVTFLEDQNPPRGYAVISTNSSVSTSNATYLQTRNAKGSELQIYEGIPAVSAFLSLAGPMQARRPSSSESVTQQSSPKFSIPRALRFVLYKHYAIDWFYWQTDLSELNPTAKVIKNFFVIVSYSTSDSEESTTLRMKWYLTVTQDMSSMTLVALKQVEH